VLLCNFQEKRDMKLFSDLVAKLEPAINCLPIKDIEDLGLVYSPEHFIPLIKKHINIVERRIIKGETILQQEKKLCVSYKLVP
jgi:hypothetical protein